MPVSKLKLLLWILPFYVVVLGAVIAIKKIEMPVWAKLLLIALEVLLGFAYLTGFLRWVRGMDELQQRAFADSAVVVSVLGVIALFIYPTLQVAGFAGAFEPEIAAPIYLCMLMAGFVRAMMRFA